MDYESKINVLENLKNEWQEAINNGNLQEATRIMREHSKLAEELQKLSAITKKVSEVRSAEPLESNMILNDENECLKQTYDELRDAKKLAFKEADFEKLAAEFVKLGDYNDSAALAAECESVYLEMKNAREKSELAQTAINSGLENIYGENKNIFAETGWQTEKQAEAPPLFIGQNEKSVYESRQDDERVEPVKNSQARIGIILQACLAVACISIYFNLSIWSPMSALKFFYSLMLFSICSLLIGLVSARMLKNQFSNIGTGRVLILALLSVRIFIEVFVGIIAHFIDKEIIEVRYICFLVIVHTLCVIPGFLFARAESKKWINKQLPETYETAQLRSLIKYSSAISKLRFTVTIFWLWVVVFQIAFKSNLALIAWNLVMTLFSAIGAINFLPSKIIKQFKNTGGYDQGAIAKRFKISRQTFLYAVFIYGGQFLATGNAIMAGLLAFEGIVCLVSHFALKKVDVPYR